MQKHERDIGSPWSTKVSSEHSGGRGTPHHRSHRFVGVLFSGFVLIVAVIAPVALATSTSALDASQLATKSPHSAARVSSFYSVGTPDASQPSGESPPTTSEIPGYQLSSVTTFSGSSVPPGWIVFSGTPSGDPGGQWAVNHVDVSGNMLQLNSFADPNFNNEWVSGGICQCNRVYTYGAFFVRSRITGAGPTQVEMLWPVAGWPPEVDFDETYGGTTASQATLHYGSSNQQIHKNINIDMTKWHTWGIVWTPTSISYTVDGNIWGTITDPAIIPDQPMSLHIQQQTWCSSNFACPTSSQSTDVNWVAEYRSTSPGPISVGSFTGNSVAMSRTVRARVRHLAEVISRRGDSTVTLTGYADGSKNGVSDLDVSRQRASNVKKYLQQQLAMLNDTDVSVVAIGAGRSGTHTVAVNARVDSGKVFAMLK